jgi:hypothetical protein
MRSWSSRGRGSTELDAAGAAADDSHVIVEYAGIVSAVAVLAATLSGAFGGKLAVLPTTNGTAVASLNAAAKAQKVAPAGARAAYKRAPYDKPVLKYLYAVGWIGGTKSAATCLFAKVTRADTEAETLREIRKNAKLVAQLKKRRVPQKQAAAVVTAGIASAC